jgi:3-phenylpropionate/trans-cinnamate dioxygenase ferredoxin reductase subunit
VSDRAPFVIVGGGVAGARAVETLRVEGYDGRIVLVAAEPELPYERPPLSKRYLAGADTRADAQVHDGGYYADHDVELRLGTAAAGLDAEARRVRLASGEELAYDRLLIATGADPRRPPVGGANGERVHVLRSVADADALRAAIADGSRLAIVGAGWIGCEVAATARGLGADVTLIERGAGPLEPLLGARLAAFFADLHRGHGVELLTNATVAGIEHGGRRVRLTDARTIDCDAVLLSVGVAPAAALAAAAGLATHDGIVADALLRTSAPGVFAAGDVASVWHPRYERHLRVEHWDNAGAQGAAAARSMLDAGEPFMRLPYFFSDQYDLGLEYVGRHDPADELTLRGSVDDGRFQAFWIAADGTVSAAMHVNDWDAIEPIRALVAQRVAVDPTRLTV